MNGILKTITFHINQCKIVGYNNRQKEYSLELTDTNGKVHPIKMSEAEMTEALRTERETNKTLIVK
jgi:hypothetical protein